MPRTKNFSTPSKVILFIEIGILSVVIVIRVYFLSGLMANPESLELSKVDCVFSLYAILPVG